MQTIRIAAVSMNSPLGQHEETLAKMAGYCRDAAEAGAELILFPELVIHGHCTPNTWEIAEPVPDGPSVKRICELAREYQLFVSCGMSEKEREIVFNTQILVGPDGYIGKQRKIHCSRDENFYYKGGKELPVFDIGKCKVGMIICYDNQFPELARILTLRGAEVILMPHAAREGMWHDASSETLARRKVFHFFSSYAMRARENATYCIYADQAGKAGIVPMYPADHFNQPNHPGGAIIFAPNGEIIKHTQLECIEDEMLISDLAAEPLTAARSHPNFTIRNRRPELFGELAKDQVTW
ncbi:MAG: nitrilase-related carbon-nitrogen hydrolase [Planctomycetaceae bacterium]